MMETQPQYTGDVSDVESRHDSNQRLTVFGAALGAIGLALQNLYGEILDGGFPLVVITITALVGWAVFAVGVYRNMKLRMTAEGREFIASAQTDERLVRFRAEAFTFGFAAMIGLQVVMLVAGVALESTQATFLTIPVATSATIAAGVSAAVLRYQILSTR